jgi:antitoxin component of RelBE/YafQ-DinJ toxin-antitoxin module
MIGGSSMIERSFRIDESVYEQLKEISDTENLPISYLVRIAISQFINGYLNSVSLLEVENNA